MGEIGDALGSDHHPRLHCRDIDRQLERPLNRNDARVPAVVVLRRVDVFPHGNGDGLVENRVRRR